MKRIRAAAFGSALLASVGIASAQAAPDPATQSRVTAMRIWDTQPVGTFNSVAYTRIAGAIEGVVDGREDVVGLGALPKNAQGQYSYSSEFEIIEPSVGELNNEVIFIDAENRGGAVMLNLLNEAGVAGPPSRAVYREGIGNGFLQRYATSYARVQWQTNISKGVPATAQGIGLVIMRDFARMLAGHTERPAGYNDAAYGKLILGGKSQSAWFVNVFVAEGFNVEPTTGKGIFQAALAVDGLGHWMALNTLAAKHGIPQAPYIGPNEKPLAAAALLIRPASDPLLIDTAAYTDFYRLRASLSDAAITTAKYRRYDIPTAHAPATPPIGQGAFDDCNNGRAIPLNPISMSPYVRAQLLGAEKAIGVKTAQNAVSLPPSTVFKLGAAPASTANFNPLPGTVLQVPEVDANAMPVGGVRFPESLHPLGKPFPVSIAPVSTASIDATCGNRGGFQPFTKAELTAKYGTKDRYLTLYRQALRPLVQQGFLLAEDEPPMLEDAGYLWDNAENYLAR